MKKLPVVVIACLTLLLAACETGVAIKSPTIKVYKFDGSISCDQSSGVSMQTMQDELKRSKIPVLSSSCGSDGLVRAAVCGIETGHVKVFEIAANAYSKARSLGYQNLSQLTDYTDLPCRS